MNADLLIVGAGPVGLATAIHAARTGMNVTVVDRREAPIDKSCGEGLMPGGVDALHAMGVEIPAWGRHPFVGIRYIDGAHMAEGRFKRAVGWGVRRTVLHEALLTRARALGVIVHMGCALKTWEQHELAVVAHTEAGLISAPYLVAADGLHSRIRQQLGLAGRPSAHAILQRFGLGKSPARDERRFGLRRHFRMAPWSSFVEVYWSPVGEAYVTPVGPDQVGVAILARGDGMDYDTLLGRFPALLSRIEGAAPCSDVRGAGPLRQNVKRRYRGRVVLVGDAAGYVDALTGEGLTLGFRSAEALVHTLARRTPLAEYERAYRRLSSAYYRDTRLLLHIAARPRLRHQLMGLLATWPGLFSWLLHHHGVAPLAAPTHPMPLRRPPRFGRLNPP